MIFLTKCNTFANSIASPSVYRPVRPAKFPVIPMEHLVHWSPDARLIQIRSLVNVKHNPIHLPNLCRCVNPVHLIQKRCTREQCVNQMSKETNWTRAPDNMSSYEIFMWYEDLWGPFVYGESLISPSIKVNFYYHFILLIYFIYYVYLIWCIHLWK